MRIKEFSKILIALFTVSVILSSCTSPNTKNNDSRTLSPITTNTDSKNNSNATQVHHTDDTGDKNTSEGKVTKKLSPDEAIDILVSKKGFKKEDLEYSGTDEDTGDYMITLSPKQSKGAAGRTFFINPITGEIK